MNEQAKKLPKPTSYDDLYPGRFIKAADFKGKQVTLTIADVELEELEGEDGKRVKAIVWFKEAKKSLVLCKTNGLCCKAMFGREIANWLTKRVTLFEDQWNGEPCVRVWGSPDIAEDMEIQIALPRRRPFNKTMHRVTKNGKGANGKSSTAAMSEPPPEYWDEAAAERAAIQADQ